MCPPFQLRPIWLTLLLLFSCAKLLAQPEYTLIDTDEDGIFVEKFKDKNIQGYAYTLDNKIFQAHSVFEYHVYHITKDGRRHYWEADPDGNHIKWTMVDTSKASGNAVVAVRIVVLEDGGLATMMPDTSQMDSEMAREFIKMIREYDQTTIEYQNITKSGEVVIPSQTGVIENRKNIWLHPPRHGFFKRLEVTPFPYVQLPLKVNDSWTWELSIGEYWSDPRWATWQGSITNEMTYEVTEKTEVAVPLGKFGCHKIESKAKSKIGYSGLNSFYNPEVGFVKMEFMNHDESLTVFELTRADIGKPTEKSE